MAEYKFNGQSNLVWGETFKMGGKVPAIANRIFDTYSAALAFANDVTAKGTAIPGLILSVFEDSTAKNNGVYRIVSVATAEGANDAVLEKVGSGNGSVVATNYSEALANITSDNIGQIIYLSQDETVDDGASGFTAISAPYIVVPSATAENGVDLKILDTRDVVETDVADEVASLNSQIGVIRDDVAKKADKLEDGTYTTVTEVGEKTQVAVKVSTDEGNLLKAGSDNGLFAGLYYECSDDEDLEKTI